MKSKMRYWATVFGSATLFLTGCVVVDKEPRRGVVIVESDRHGPPPWAPAHGWRRKHEYHYYPIIQVYYYPHVKRYYWLEGSDWKTGVRLPSYFVIEESRKVIFELDDEPHKHHGRIKNDYPSDYFERGKGRGRDRS